MTLDDKMLFWREERKVSFFFVPSIDTSSLLNIGILVVRLHVGFSEQAFVRVFGYWI